MALYHPLNFLSLIFLVCSLSLSLSSFIVSVLLHLSWCVQQIIIIIIIIITRRRFFGAWTIFVARPLGYG